ncbi:MAG: hypothetical protein GWP02_06290 [Desulfobulbaceae bacterium]|nr:hypothetical protein [Desulfobulbaceae bacterium]
MLTKAETWLKKALDYQFNDARLLGQALTHRSAPGDNNERLEFLGDAVLDFVISEVVFRAFPMAPEGDLSRLRASLVKDTSLATLAADLGLGEHLILGSGERKTGGHRRESILADALEAVFGARKASWAFGRGSSCARFEPCPPRRPGRWPSWPWPTRTAGCAPSIWRVPRPATLPRTTWMRSGWPHPRACPSRCTRERATARRHCVRPSRWHTQVG